MQYINTNIFTQGSTFSSNALHLRECAIQKSRMRFNKMRHREATRADNSAADKVFINFTIIIEKEEYLPQKVYNLDKNGLGIKYPTGHKSQKKKKIILKA